VKAEPEKPLDEEWAEAPVVFGPAASPNYGGAAMPGCGSATPRPAVVQIHAAAARRHLTDKDAHDEHAQHVSLRDLPLHPLVVFLAGSLIRFDREQYTWKSDSSQLLRRGQLRLGSNLFHIGILGIFFGHFVGLLTPSQSGTRWRGGVGEQMLAIVAGGSSASSCWSASSS